MPEGSTITPLDVGQRLDIYCVQQLPNHSRSAIQRAIKDGLITVNKRAVKPSYVLKAADQVLLTMPQPTLPLKPVPQPKIPILYEDREVVVINKPAGIAAHAGVGTGSITVAAWFADRYPQSADVGEADIERAGPEVELRSATQKTGSPERALSKFHFRAGIVHRLDKETSGVMILAKTSIAYQRLKQQFQRRRAKKEYLALVFGVPTESKGRITRPLARSKRNPLRRAIDPAGKPAITEWRKEESFQGRYALIRAYPLTGRTHQIRAHLHFLGFPIVGDALYTFKRQRPPQGVQRQMLHAEHLSLTLPSGKETLFTAPLAEDFARVLEQLRSPS